MSGVVKTVFTTLRKLYNVKQTNLGKIDTYDISLNLLHMMSTNFPENFTDLSKFYICVLVTYVCLYNRHTYVTSAQM